MEKARQERGKAYGDGKGLTAEGMPDVEMLEWLQMVDNEEDAMNEGKGPNFEMVLVWMDWEV